MRAETLAVAGGSEDGEGAGQAAERPWEGCSRAALAASAAPPGGDGGLEGGASLGDAASARLTGGFVDPPRLGACRGG